MIVSLRCLCANTCIPPLPLFFSFSLFPLFSSVSLPSPPPPVPPHPFPSSLGHHRPQEDPHNNQPPEQLNWPQLIFGFVAITMYYLLQGSDPIPEVSFPFFLQQMLNTGEVRQTPSACLLTLALHVQTHVVPQASCNPLYSLHLHVVCMYVRTYIEVPLVHHGSACIHASTYCIRGTLGYAWTTHILGLKCALLCSTQWLYTPTHT